MSRRRLACIAFAPALVLAACSSDDSSASSSTDVAASAITSATENATDTRPPVPEGFIVVDRSSDGFVIALPRGWQTFDLTSADVDAMVQAAGEANPNLQGDVGDAVKKLVDEGGLLYASETTNSDKFPTRLNIIKVTGATGGLALLEQQAQTQLAAAGATSVSSTETSLPAGDAVRTTYTVPITLSDGTKAEIAGVQVYVPTEKDLYVLTFSTDQPDKYMQTFDQIIATFSLT
jgi:hypothetical protein